VLTLRTLRQTPAIRWLDRRLLRATEAGLVVMIVTAAIDDAKALLEAPTDHPQSRHSPAS
jgi:hypothetical protein